MSNLTKFRADEDLMFLEDVSGEDLEILAEALIYDAAGNQQWTGNLHGLFEKLKESYGSDKQLYKDNWKAIAAELQLFGGDSAVNLVRRRGVVYREILEDVAKHTDTDYDISEGIDKTEERLLRTLFGKIPTLDDKEEIYNTLQNKGFFPIVSLLKDPVETLKNISNTKTVAKSGGMKSLIGGLGIAAQVVSKLHPATAVASATLPILGLTGTAYRITIPAVCFVAIMRIKHNQGQYD